ncbi:CLIP domain-containing serine protease B4-like [Drosophila takahashii]|uniref:CLIP domain-containing serine protease B4-like n=1 Tax=Drosophila takahashii TaxID=29030 RepID=UPI00389959F1
MCGFVSLVLIALVLSQSAFSELLDDNCGGLTQLTYRVVGGRFEYVAPFMASLYNGTEFVCGGTLIHKSYVLTAAHCVQYIEEINVHLGEIDRSCSQTQCPHVQHRIAKVIAYPGFKNMFEHDIALLKLDKEVRFNENIRPICIILDEEATSDEASTFSAHGWGKTETEKVSVHLKTVTLYRLDRGECPYIRGGNTICAGSETGDTCHGDSGGPLAANTTYRAKTIYVQHGVVSYGDGECKNWGVYTDVSAYKLWIANTVLESQPRLMTENCRSDWGSKVLIRLWEMSLFQRDFSGALITNQFVLTVASAFPSSVTKIQVESKYLHTYDVEWFHLHPAFSASPSIKNNIAVIKLTNKVPRSVQDLVRPICLGLNLSPPTAWNAFLYSLNDAFMGIKMVDLKKIDNCSAKTKLPVQRDQFCIEKPDQSKYAPYETPGSVIGTMQTIGGSERYLIAALISHIQDNVIVLTKIQDHQKWIANELKG